jgi:hypothetical protein
VANHLATRNVVFLRQGDQHYGHQSFGAKRFYGSSQAFCEASRIEYGFVGVHRPSGSGDAPDQTVEHSPPKCHSGLRSIRLSTVLSALYKHANDNKYASLRSAIPVLFMSAPKDKSDCMWYIHHNTISNPSRSASRTVSLTWTPPETGVSASISWPAIVIKYDQPLQVV